MKITKEEIFSRFKESSYRPLHMREMLLTFKVSKEGRRAFKRMIKELVRDGEIIKTRKNQYGLPEKMSLIAGRLQCHRDGYGFVIPEKTGEADIFIPSRNLSGAMHGDRVISRIEHFREGMKREGRVIRVLERAHKRVVGKYEESKNFRYVVPNDPRIGQDIYIGPRERKEATRGDIVVAEILSYPSPTRGPEGRIIKILGRPDDSGITTDIIIEEYELPQSFPSKVLEESKMVPQKISKTMFRKRKDLRDLNTVTIDGEKAMDFDDAVSVKRLSGGSILLWVHIADVSYYVPWDSLLDEEARIRGTSTYFPDRVIPMLPEELSNGICSLKPHKDRLAVTVEMEFDREGNRVRTDFYDCVINSNERMTYTSVKKILVDQDPEECKRYRYLIDDFRIIEELALRLRDRRMHRGSLDFDLPEPEIILNLRGEIKDILIAERNIAHRIIEEFMIAANEAVASYISDLQIPFIYRIHEEPNRDKVEEFLDFLKGFGYLIKKKIHSRVLQRILEEVKNKPEERLINNVMLRSMKQARYSVENLSHFGLASRCYTHFTSPIRRYPDLIVHRILKEARNGPLPSKKKCYLEGILNEIAIQTSERERIADEAEREAVDSLKVRFMKDKVGEEYKGVITGVASYGLFVQLKDIFVEGLVHISALRDDYYSFNERSHLLAGKRTKRTYRLGDEVKVRVDRVDLERRQIDLSLVP
ncbi:MAG: ribonuclease R [Nitrospirae bacterium]|nr:ribonuclease R [Nitrospirota bacterium]